MKSQPHWRSCGRVGASLFAALVGTGAGRLSVSEGTIDAPPAGDLTQLLRRSISSQIWAIRRRDMLFKGANMNSPSPLPVERALVRLGENLSRARRRRRMSQAMLAERIGASVNTVRRMEEGFGGTAMQYVARALQVFGELNKLEALMDVAADDVGLALLEQTLPQRVRARRRTPETGAF